MPYTINDPPDWLKNLPKDAIAIGIEAFNAVWAEYEDDAKAREAAWGAIKQRYEQDKDGTWRAKTDIAEELLSLTMRMEAADTEGAAWDVTICRPGFTKNGWYLPEEAIREAAALFEGADINIFELPNGAATHLPDEIFELKSLLVKNKVGWLEGARYIAGEGLKATLQFLDSGKWIGKNLIEAMKQKAAVYGLSFDAPVMGKENKREGRTVMELTKFLSVDSVDIVTRPAAGGAFNRAIASELAHNHKEDLMNREALLTLIGEKRPDLLNGKDLKTITDEQVMELARMAMEPIAQASGEPGGDGNGADGKPGAAPAAKNNVDDAARAQMAAYKELMDRFRCEMALDKALAQSELPDLARERIRTMFSEEADGEKRVKLFAPAELEKAIGAEKDYVATMAAAQEPQDAVPGSHISGGLDSFDRACMAVDRTFGLSKEDVEALARMTTLTSKPFFEENLGAAGRRVRSVQDLGDYDKIPAFEGIREMYAFFTGDPQVSGLFNRQGLTPGLRSRMDITSATFTYVLGNTLGRRLVKEYKEPDYLEGLLISVKKRVKDFRTQEAVKVGGFPDLETVNPEAADYNEIVGITDEEVTYSLIQKGNILTISRKTIINDDISIITRAIDKLGRAARRTHGQYVWHMYIDNDTCTDGTAVFTNPHTNLGSGALTHTTAYAAWAALAAMTEKDSGKYLGLLDGGQVLNLVGPPAIMNLIKRIEQEEFYYSTNDLTDKLPNPLYGLIKGHTLSLLSADAEDWYMLVPPNVAELIEMGYLNGREEPEFFVADTPTSEQVFVADKIRHKVRHEYAGAPIDYVGAYKAVV
jgi:cation transport regulator ChaB